MHEAEHRDRAALRRLVGALGALAALALTAPPGAGAQEAEPPRAGPRETGPPNVVIVMADDLGYGDVRALNPDATIATPSLDRLAAEGMLFSDLHAPSSVCTPTRYGLLTGRYCWRTRLKSGVLWGRSRHLIDAGRPTIASLLKSRGYTTACVGKWHLGLDWASATGRAGDGDTGGGADTGPREVDEIDFAQPIANGPLALGFDSFFGIPASLDMPPYVFVRDDRVDGLPTATQAAQPFPAFVRQGARAPDLVMEDVLDRLLARALEEIRARAREAKPFFLYFPLTAPHKPVAPHERFHGRTRLGPYGDFVAQVDWTVGQVLDTLAESGVEKRTLVLFTSDNGSFMYRREAGRGEDHVDDPGIQAFRADRHEANGDLRGTKADIWEAGHRVPFLARWPGRIAPGSRCDVTACLTDIFATLAEITGAELPAAAAEDSISLLPHLEGKAPARPRPPVIHHSVAGMFAIRDGRWKLVLGNGSGGREAPRGSAFERPYQLFDLERDRRERDNAIEAHPDVARRLEAEFERLRDAGRSR